MSPKLFWHTTPRKFSALCQVHVDLNDTTKKDSRTKNKTMQPDAYVDQLSFM